ncbi:HAD-IA family hydrolase [Kineococcus gynurae]|uniref:HAD-IA family hydrolase n=1 Tax=Kineococcus gynurae TaxID=452979 RepID=A0ABV5LX46_9ACTN
MKLPHRAILFDSDGVLVDSDASVHSAWSRWAIFYGLDPDEVADMVHGRRSADTVALLVPAEQQQEALSTVDRYEVEDALQVTAMPGSRELVTGLPAGSWAVVTSAVTALALARLRAAGLPRPEVLVTADDVTAGKPSPEGYRAAAARLGVDPADCIVCEDSPAGIRAGLDAGATVVGIGERARGNGAAVVVQDLRGLRLVGGDLVVQEEYRLPG